VTGTTLRTGLVILIALLLQVAILPWLTIRGAQIDLLIIVGIAAGLTGGPDRGARVGFVCGLAWDLVVDGPLGLSALAYCLAGYFVGSAQRSVVGPTWWAPIPAAAIAAGGATAFYAVIGAGLGHTEWIGGDTLVVVLVVAFGAAVLVLPAMRILAWTEGESLGLRLPRLPRRRSSFRPGRGRRTLTTGIRR
jgi:rod shape-determining protein MreD